MPGFKVPTARHEEMLAQLNVIQGEAIDAAYLQMQVQAHEEAVVLFQDFAGKGDTALQNFAEAKLPTLQQHLEEVQKLAGE